jgi:hypothetical protein
MLDSVIKWLQALIPFLAPYPVWVKYAFAAFVLSGAVFLIGLVVAARDAGRPSSVVAARDGDRPNSDSEAWLNIRGVDGYANEGHGIQIVAEVDNIKYTYPSNTEGVKWLEISPTMASQAYQIPVGDTHEVRFSGQLQNGPPLRSPTVQRVEQADSVRTYNLYVVDPDNEKRSTIAVTVKYTITSTHPAAR